MEDVMTGRQVGTSPLTLTQLTQLVPALTVSAPHASRSDKYAFVPTLPVVKALGEVGFEPYAAQSAAVRDADREGFQKHLIRFRHSSNVAGSRGGVGELVMISSHDGRKSWQLYAGWFEFLCSNGLVVGDKAAELRIPHKGKQEEVLQLVQDGARDMVLYLAELAQRRQEWLETPCNYDNQLAFAKDVIKLRYDDSKHIPIEPTQLLVPRREAEMLRQSRHAMPRPRENVWSTLNVLQENAIQGGIVGRDSNGRIRTQKAIKSIDRGTQLNRDLWRVAERYAA